MSNLSRSNLFTESFSSDSDDIRICWNIFLTIPQKQTAISHFLWDIVEKSNGQIFYTDFRHGTNIDRRFYSPIINGTCRPSHETLRMLAKSECFTEQQREELLAFCDTKRALQIINSIIKTNLRLSSIDNKIIRLQLQNDVLFSAAELKKIANGALSGNRTVLKLCFGLHCSLSQSEQLLNAYGYCWQNDEVSSFLKEELSLKRYKATDILCDWEIYARKLVA